MNKKASPNTFITNRRASHDYIIHEKFEAGLALEGWEVKAIRSNRGQIQEGYISIQDNECWLVGSNITPLDSTVQHSNPDPTRKRKLLLHKKEITKLYGQHKIKGYTIIPLKVYLSNRRFKIAIALASGKKLHDKRQADKEKTWKRDKLRLQK